MGDDHHHYPQHHPGSKTIFGGKVFGVVVADCGDIHHRLSRYARLLRYAAILTFVFLILVGIALL